MKQITTILLLLISLSGIGQALPSTSHTIKVKGSGGSGTTDTALIKSLISDSTKRFGIQDNLGLQDRSVDMQDHYFYLNNIADFDLNSGDYSSYFGEIYANKGGGRYVINIGTNPYFDLKLAKCAFVAFFQVVKFVDA